MNIRKLSNLNTELMSLAVFRDVLSDRVVAALCDYLTSLERGAAAESVSYYAEFVSRLYESGSVSLSDYVRNLCENCENVYVKLIGAGKTPPKPICESVRNELGILQRAASLTPELLTESLDWKGALPSFETGDVDLAESYARRVENIGKYGYGKYARSRMFCVGKDGSITAVKNPDDIRLDSLVDYERERKLIIDNTKALLCGKPAANILLTGDSGTGKSSTVKAVVNEFYPEGLRIIEIGREQLHLIPRVLEELSANPLKFILFIDDISFLNGDENFNALKAVLEGSVSAKSRNVAVYATSNRRHIVRESFADREGDEIHVNDTIQETVSLSERFGLHITFQKPDKNTYLHIVHSLAQKDGVDVPPDELERSAERFALSRGGRSARIARQFVDGLLSGRPV